MYFFGSDLAGGDMIARRSATLVWLLVFAILCMPCTLLGKAIDPVEQEKKLGQEAAKDIEKSCKLLNDEALISRVNSIGSKLADIAKTTQIPATYGDNSPMNFDYTFKVVDDKSVNAFSLPGGIIYINKGLLDYVQSDDELAAVIAHEIAHSSHRHVRSLMKEQSKLQSSLMLILLAGLLSNIPQRDIGHLMLGTEFYKTAKLSGYSIEAERDADATAIQYLMKSNYNPVGMLTFLERLGKRPDPKLGIYQNHPDVAERVQNAVKQLKTNNIEINRRKVIKARKAEYREVNTDGKIINELVVAGKPVLKLKADKTKLENACTYINTCLDNGVCIRDVPKPDSNGNVFIKDKVAISIAPDDAALNGMSCSEAANKVADNIRRVIWEDMLEAIRD
jgi:hypothetical protein